jgi:hypothetical protein
MAWLAAAIAEALRVRGVPEPQATLAAQTGVTVFGVAYRQWLEEGEGRSLDDLEAEVLAEVRTLSLAAG